eukprot:300105_1
MNSLRRSKHMTLRSKYKKKAIVLKKEHDAFKDIPIMDSGRFIQMMGQRHNRENDTFSDSYVDEQCNETNVNDCDINTQILRHPRSPLTNIDTNTLYTRELCERNDDKQARLCHYNTPTSRYRTAPNKSPLRGANAKINSLRIQNNKLKDHIAKLTKINNKQSVSIEAYKQQLNELQTRIFEVKNVYIIST